MTGNTAGSHQVRVGDIVVTALKDGTFTPEDDWVTDADAEAAGVGPATGLPRVPPGISVNAFLVRGPWGTALIDTGMGPGGGAALGHTSGHLADLGLSPADIDVILLTHLHSDHIGGLRDSEGNARFPGTDVLLHEAEAGFWLGAEALDRASSALRPWIEGVQNTMAPYDTRLRTVADRAEVRPGITARHLPGHTPGHTGWLIASGGQTLLLFADVVHLQDMQFRVPDVTMAFDHDRAVSINTRRRMLAEAADQGWIVAGAHLTFPPFGTLERDGDGFRFVPLAAA